ncbi:hypothetical protein F4776DRAFT_549490 [Hypoxylon sp. NC0597]|nr:hypothetical protein F4776DRAFT_549490 [Hypoxylon sp. NC0597]
MMRSIELAILLSIALVVEPGGWMGISMNVTSRYEGTYSVHGDGDRKTERMMPYKVRTFMCRGLCKLEWLPHKQHAIPRQIGDLFDCDQSPFSWTASFLLLAPFSREHEQESRRISL